MGNPAQAYRLAKVPGGVEMQGIAKSDRGTKYIVNSSVILFKPGQKTATKEQIKLAIEELTASSE